MTVMRPLVVHYSLKHARAYMVTYFCFCLAVRWLEGDGFWLIIRSIPAHQWNDSNTVFILCVSYDSCGDQTLSSLLNLAFPVLFVGLKMIFSECKSCFSKPPNTLQNMLQMYFAYFFQISSFFDCSVHSPISHYIYFESCSVSPRV